MRPPTDRQLEVLDMIRTYVRHHRRPPTLRDLADRMCARSASAPLRHIRRLAEAGLIRLNPTGSRRIQLVDEHELTCPTCGQPMPEAATA